MLRSRTLTSTTGATSANSDQLPPELRRMAVAIGVGAFMVALDMTMVNVALRTLTRDFHASVTTVQWVSTGFLLALAMAIPLSGWAIERFGARQSWVGSPTMFIAGSVRARVVTGQPDRLPSAAGPDACSAWYSSECTIWYGAALESATATPQAGEPT